MIASVVVVVVTAAAVVITLGLIFINILRTAFALVDPKSVKIPVKSSVSFYAFGIYKRKSCS